MSDETLITEAAVEEAAPEQGQAVAEAQQPAETACEATDIIIAQADNLRMVMGKPEALVL